MALGLRNRWAQDIDDQSNLYLHYVHLESHQSCQPYARIEHNKWTWHADIFKEPKCAESFAN